MSEQPPKRESRRIKPAAPAPDAYQPWMPREASIEDASAIRFCYNGTASPELQRRAMDFIMKEICGIGKTSFIPGGPEGARASDFAQGKRAVGLEIAALISARIDRGGEQP